MKHLMFTCPTCKKRKRKPSLLLLEAGCTNHAEGAPSTQLLSETDAAWLEPYISLRYSPDASGPETTGKRRKMVLLDVLFQFQAFGQGQIQFCGFACVRRFLRELETSIKRHSASPRSKKKLPDEYVMTTFPEH